MGTFAAHLRQHFEICARSFAQHATRFRSPLAWQSSKGQTSSSRQRLRRGRPKKYADERREPRDAERVYLAMHSHRVYDVGVILGVPLGVMFMPRTVLADAYTQTFNDLLVTKQNGTILIFSPFPPIPSITGTIQNLTKRASTTRPLVCP